MASISIGATVVPNWKFSAGSTAKLRLFCSQNFLTSDLKSIQAGSPETDNFYLEVNITISGTNATIAAFSIDSTTDFRAGAGARYSAYFYTDGGVLLSSFGGYESFEVPSIPTSTTLDAIRIYNASPVARPPDLLTYSRIEILNLIDAIMPGGINPLSTGGTGSNLSAAGPGLLRQATLGANVTVSALSAADLQGALTIREVDLSPSFGASTIEFNQGDGFVVTNQGSGVARVSLSSFPIANTTGTLQPARGGTGATAAPTNGQLLIGNTAMGIFAVASLGVGASLVATPGAGSLSLNTIQDIRTTDSPTFAGVITTAQEGLRIGPYGAGAGQTGEIRMRELAANGTHYFGQKAADSMAATYVIVWPADAPTAGQMPTAGTPVGAVIPFSWTSPPGAGTGYDTIQEEGSDLAQRSTLDIIGAALTAADTGAKTTVTLSQSPIGSISVVGVDREITSTGGTIGGVGDLSADLDLDVVDDTSIQKIRVSKGGSLVGTRREVNVIEGANVTLTVTDDAGANRVDVTIASTGGGAGGISGSGTTTFLPKFSSSTAIADSLLSDDGAGVIYLNPFGGAASSLRFYDDNSSNYVGIKAAGTVTSNITLTLPTSLTATTATNRYVQTDASGNLSVAAAVGSLTLDDAGSDVALATVGNDLTLSIPDAGASARGVVTTGAQTFAGAKTFTDNLKLSKAFPSFLFEDTGSVKHLLIESLGGSYDFRESAGATGSLLNLDVTNNRVGIGKASPDSLLDVKGLFTFSGSTSGSVGVQAPATGGSGAFTLPNPSAGFLASDGDGILSITSAYATVEGNGTPVTQRDTINVADGTNTTVTVDDSGGKTRIRINATGGGSGTVTDFSVEDENQFSVSNPTTTPQLSINPNVRTTDDAQIALILPDVPSGVATAGAYAVNTLFVYRIYIKQRIRFNSLALSFSAALNGNKFSLAIFEPSGSAKLLDSGVFTTAGGVARPYIANIAGTEDATITGSAVSGADATLDEGWYLIGFTANGGSYGSFSISTVGLMSRLFAAGAANGLPATTHFYSGSAGATAVGVIGSSVGSVTANPGTSAILVPAFKLFST